MAKRINRSEALDNLNKQLDESIVKFGVLGKAIKASDDVLNLLKKKASELGKSIAGIDVTKPSALKELNQAQKESNKIAIDTIRIQTAKEKLSQQEERTKQQQLRTEKLRNQESKKTLTSYQLESRALNEMRDRYKDLAVQQEKGVKLSREEQKEMRNLAVQIRQTDASLKRIDASTGQFQRNVGNYTSAVNGFKGALNQLGIAFGVFELFNFGKKTLVGFEEGAANMAKTLQTTVDVAKGLSRELANIDTRTTLEDLQAIASIGGQLGESSGSIVEFTKSIDMLNVALGDEFTGGAEEVTTVLGGLRNVLSDIKTGDSAKDLLSIGNALNVLGAEGTATSPVISDFASRISGIGIPLGLTSDQILGLSATLQELNINSERGGTAVGAILQRITRDTKGFAQLAGKDVKDFEKLLNTDLLGALKLVSSGFNTLQGDSVKQSKVLEQLNLTGSGASEVFLKLGGNIDLLETRVTQAGEALKNTDSITQEFNVKNNTLGATIDKLEKEFQKYVLGMDESGKVTGSFSSILQFLVNNMQTILKVVGQGIKAWITYKAVMKAMELQESIKNWRDLGGSITASTEALKNGELSAKSFGNALKGIGFTAIIQLAWELGNEVYRIVSGMRLMEEHARISENVFSKRDRKELEDFIKLTNKNNNDRINQIEKLRKEGKISDDEASKRALESENERKKALLERIKYLRQQKDIVLLSLEAERNAYKTDPNLKTKQAIIDLVAREKFLSSQIEIVKGETIKLNTETQDLTVSFDKQTKKTKELNTQLKEQNEYLSQQADLLYELNNLVRESEIDKQTERIEKLKEEALKQMELTGMPSGNLGKIKEAIDARSEMEKQAVEATLQYRLDQLNEAYLKETELARKAIEDNRKELLSQEGLTNEAKLKIESDYQEKLKQLEQDNLKRSDDLTTSIQIAEQQKANDLVEIEKKKNDEIIATTEELNAKQEEFDQKRLDSLKKIEEEEDKKRKERLEKENEYIETLSKYWNDHIDERIARLDELSEASKKQQDYLNGLAESGNIQAQQSIVEEKRIQREAQAEKARLEKQKQYIQMFTAFMTNYNNKLSEGKSGTEALTEALADKTVLEAVLKSLPSFFVGADRLSNDGKAIDNKGGFLAINHPGERVVPASENDELVFDNGQIVPNSMLPKIFNEWKAGMHVDPSKSINNYMVDNSQVISKLDELKDAISNLPKTDYNLEEILDGVFQFSKKVRKGNDRIVDRKVYRTK